MSKNCLSAKAQARLRRIKELNLPEYTTAEELMNAISHGVGAMLAIAAIVLLIVFSDLTAKAVTSVTIYSASLFILYIVSTLYHALAPNKAKKVFRILDHCSIFLLIAGTYTPICLLVLGGATGWVLFGVVWLAAVVGIVFNSIDIKKFAKFSMICYIAMGWGVIFAIKPLIDSITAGQLALLVSGGLAYTAGAGLYGLGKKYKYVHSVWHVFVLAGSILQFFMVLSCVSAR